MARLTRPPLVLLATLLALSCGVAQPAAPAIIVNGRPLQSPCQALNRDGALLLPLRVVFEALQAQVRWYPTERKIEARRGEDLVELWVGTPVAHANHNPIQLRVPPLIIAGVTYVPLRFPAEAFGGTVRWEPATRTVYISTTPP